MAATLSKSWRVVRHHASCYTDANAKLDRSHSQQIIPPPPSLPFSPLIACWNNGNVSLLDLTTGHITHTLHSLSDDSFTTFAISPSHSLLATVASRSSLLTLHSLTPPHYATLSSIKTTPYHSQPITAVAFSPSSTLLATASLDRSLRLFHLPSLSLHLTLRGHSHPLHLLAFHPTLPHLLSSDTSGHLRLWDLSHPSGLCHPLPPHHLSPLTSLTHLTPSLLLTAALDNVLCLWSTTTLPYTLLRTIPVYEPVRAITPWPPSSPLPPGSSPLSKGGPGEVAVTGGEKGELKWWEVRTGRLLQTHAMPSVLDASSSTPSPAASKFIANQIASLFLLPCPPPPPSSSSSSPSPPSSSPPFHLVVVTMEQNFHLFSPTLTPGPLYIGHNDEILDLRFHPTTPHLIAATNSPQVRVFHTQQLHAAAILSGHVDVVMGVDVSGDGRWVVTASKDRTVRVWEGGGEWRCVGVCEGHAESVGCVAFSRGTAKPYIVSGARDRTVKMWDATPLLSLSPSSPSSSSPPTILSLPCLSTLAAHSKDINCIASSPNGRLIASGSEDRSISLCSSSPHSPLARLQGHRRGVWSVRFSPVEKVLASASGDKTVKVWSLVDWSCLKTLEGHVGSVKGVGWLRGGMQVMSGGDEGVVRLWTVKTSECVASWVVPTHEGGGEGEEGGEGDDEEEVGGDKVWALDVSADGKRMVTGGVGSVLNVWEDVTEVEEEAEREERVVVVGKEQRLMNAIKGKRWKEATAIALELKQPRRLHQVLAQVLKEMEGEGEVQRLLKGLADDAMDVLLTYVKDWNTNAKTATVANLVLSCLFRAVPLANLQKRKTLVDHIPGLMLYCERHFQRIDRLMQRSYLLDYTLDAMNLLLPEDEREGDDDVLDGAQVKLEAAQSPLFTSSFAAVESKEGEAVEEDDEDAVLVRAGSKRPPPVPGQLGSRILALEQLQELKVEGVDGAAGDVDDGEEGWDGSWGPPAVEQKQGQADDEEAAEGAKGQTKAKTKVKQPKGTKGNKSAAAVPTASEDAEHEDEGASKRVARRRKGGEVTEAAPHSASRTESKPRKKSRK